MQSGSITLNGVSEAQAHKLLKIKEKNEGQYFFSVSLAEPAQRDSSGAPVYNGVTLSWRSAPTLKFILSLVESLLD
jgi:hypothetical protein